MLLIGKQLRAISMVTLDLTGQSAAGAAQLGELALSNIMSELLRSERTHL